MPSTSLDLAAPSTTEFYQDIVSSTRRVSTAVAVDDYALLSTETYLPSLFTYDFMVTFLHWNIRYSN